MPEKPDPDELLELLGDPYVRTILRAASQEPMSAKELSEECDSALSTVYRRVDDLIEYDLLVEQTAMERDGSHHSVYATRLDLLTVRVANGEFDMALEVERSAPERFTSMWENIREVR